MLKDVEEVDSIHVGRRHQVMRAKTLDNRHLQSYFDYNELINTALSLRFEFSRLFDGSLQFDLGEGQL
ncbi:hypothetical protein CEXT_477641, partial [Caerostris extrusa]